MGIYAKSTRNRKFFKRRPKKGARRYRRGLVTKRDLFLLSKQITATREVKHAFTTQTFSFGSYNAANEGIPGTYCTRNLGITGGVGELGIPLGTAQNQRIGSSIRIKKVTLRMNFTVNPVNALSNPIPKPQLVRVMFGYSKPQLGQDRQKLPVDALALYMYGGSANNPAGDVRDLNVNKINTKLYTIVKRSRVMKVGNAAYFQSQIQQQDFNNNYMNMYKSYNVDLTKFYHKDQQFYSNDAGSSNRTLSMYIQTVDATGEISTSFPIGCNYELCVAYTDS